MNGYRKYIAATAIAILLTGGLVSNLHAQTPDAAKVIEAQEKAKEAEEQKLWETRIFDVKYADVNLIWQPLNLFRAQISAQPQLHVITVKAPKEIMPAIEDAIKRLDVPAPAAKSAELTVYILSASEQSSASTVPSVLQPVVNQLKNVFPYKGYQLLETQVIRGQNGRKPEVSGTLHLPIPGIGPGQSEPNYSISANFNIHPGESKEPVLSLVDLRFSMSGPGMNSVGVHSDVDIPGGQQIVVGKTNFRENAIILVMSAKFLN